MHKPWLVCLGLVSIALIGCPDDKKRPLLGTCGDDGDCESGFCGDGYCLDPSGDDDLDGLTNSVEASLGSNPLQPDSDIDGIADGTEVATDLSGVDTDGDGKLDVIESRVLDADIDCIPDQYDGDDVNPSSDLSPMRDVVCRTAGVCADQLDKLGVVCPHDQAICVYADVIGYSEREDDCDGLDENCDGRVDEGFPEGCADLDWDDDGVLDLVDVCPETPDPAQRDGDKDGVGEACVDLYEIVFDPDPPARVGVGQAFDVFGKIQRRDGAGVGAPLPPWHGRVELVSTPNGGLGKNVTTAVRGAFSLPGVSYKEANAGYDLTFATLVGRAEHVTVAVDAGPAVALVLDAPATVTAGEPFALSAVALDAFGNVAALGGAATLDSDDPDADLAPAGSFANGAWSKDDAVLHRAGLTLVTLSAGGLSADATIAVLAGAPAAIDLTLPAEVRAGVPVDATVVVRDASGNVVDPLTPIRLATSDPLGTVPASVTPSATDGLTGTFTATFGTLGEQSITAATDTLGAEAVTVVIAGAPHHLVVTPAGVATTGVPLPVAVAVVDLFGNPVDASDPYTGTVSFRVSGAQPPQAPTLPAPTTFVPADNGERSFDTTWFRAGTWRLTVTGTGLAVPSATTNIEVVGTPSNVLDLELPLTAAAGEPVALTVTVLTPAGEPATNFTGTVALRDNDARSDVPAYVALGPGDGGTKTIMVTFASLGVRTVTATSQGLSDAEDVTVRAGAPYAIRLDAPSPVVVLRTQSVGVRIVDRFGNLADSPEAPYTGTVTFDIAGTQPTPAPTLPGPITFTAAMAGRGSGAAIWRQAGTFTLRATATGLAESVATSNVQVVLARGLAVELPETITAGEPVDVVVRAVDDAGETASAFVGDVSLRDTDPRAAITPLITFVAADQGVRTVSATFSTAGALQVTAGAPGLKSGVGTTTVLAAVAASMKLTTIGDAQVRVPKAVTVTLYDRFNNVANNPDQPYTGVITFDVSGTQPALAPILPEPLSFSPGDNGRKDVVVTWSSVGTFTLRGTGTNLTTATASVTMRVLGTPAGSLELSLPGAATAGVAVPLTITVRDGNGAIAADFVGTVQLSDTDPAGGPPASVAFDQSHAGSRTIDVTFGRVGTQVVTGQVSTFTASASVVVSPGAPRALLLQAGAATIAGSPVPVTVSIIDAFGNYVPYTGTVRFRATGPQPPVDNPLAPGLPAPVTFTAAMKGRLDTAATFYRPGTWTLVATGSDLVVPSGTAQVLVSVGAPSRLTLYAPGRYAAGDFAEVCADATDAWGNLDGSYNGTAFLSVRGDPDGFLGTIEIVDSVGQNCLELPMTTAGDYVIEGESGRLFGETPVEVTAGYAYRLKAPRNVAQYPDETVEIPVRVLDYYGNLVSTFADPATVDIDIDGSTDWSSPDPDPFTYEEDDEGVYPWDVEFVIPAERLVNFDETSFYLSARHTDSLVAVLSGLDPVLVGFKPIYGEPVVGEPFSDEGFTVGLYDDNGAPTWNTFNDPIEVTVDIYRQYPGPIPDTTIAGTVTVEIPEGEHMVTFDDLEFPHDGRFTLWASAPNGEVEGNESSIFEVVYPEPEVEIEDVETDDNNCLVVDYTVTQDDDLPVTVLVEYRVSSTESFQPTHPAWSAFGDGQFDGVHGRSTVPGDNAHTYLWNAPYDLGDTQNVPEGYTIEVRVSAYAGSRAIRNKRGSNTFIVDYQNDGSPCVPDVTALRALPYEPDLPSGLLEDDDVPKRLVAYGDFDGDGHLDLARTLGDRSIGVSLGRGDGGFEPIEEHVFGDEGTPNTLAVGDLDGNGRSDIVWTTDDGYLDVAWLDGDEWEVDSLDGDVSVPTGLAVGDTDGNGRDEVAYVRDGDIVIAGVLDLPGEIDYEIVYSGGFFDEGEYIHALAFVNSDGLERLDLVFYVRWADGESVGQRLCPLFDQKGAYTFVDKGCADLFQSVETSFSEARQPLLRDLSVPPARGPDTPIYVRRGPINFGSIRHEETSIDETHTVRPLSQISACQSYEKQRLTSGLFEDAWDNADDPTYDAVGTCNTGDNDGGLGFQLYQADRDWDFVFLPNVALDDNSTIAAADFDGDGTDDIATWRGVVTTDKFEEARLQARAPNEIAAGIYPDEIDTTVGDFDGNGYPDLLSVAVEANDGDIQLVWNVASEWNPVDDPPTYTVCDFETEGPCPSTSEWRVLIEAGEDVAGFAAAPQLVLVAGADDANTTIVVLEYVDSDGWRWNELEYRQDINIVPETMAIGDLGGLAGELSDVVIGGHHAVTGNADLVALHYRDECEEFCMDAYFESSDDDLPSGGFRESFVGSFDESSPGDGNIALVDTGVATPRARVLAPLGCGPGNTACLGAIDDIVLWPFSTDGLQLDHVAKARFAGDAIDDFVVSARVDTEGGVRLEVYGVGTFGEPFTFYSRYFDQEECEFTGQADCVEDALLLVDDDSYFGHEVFVGFGHGHTWQSYLLSAIEPGVTTTYLYGATASEQARTWHLADMDQNGLRDIIVVEGGPFTPDAWLLQPNGYMPWFYEGGGPSSIAPR